LKAALILVVSKAVITGPEHLQGDGIEIGREQKGPHMNLDRLQVGRFTSGDVEIAWYEAGSPDGFPVLLIHGFASTAHVNWVFPGWVKTLDQAGFRVIALDNRGHGQSDKPHDPEAYHPETMAADAAGLLDSLGIGSAHVMGYSMGARISAFLAIARPDLVHSLVFGGLGLGMIDGVGDWDPIADALLAPSIDDVRDERGRMFRAFAEQTKSDRLALAACIRTSRTLVSREEIARLTMPTLIGVGSRDDIAGSAEGLADLMLRARALEIPNRDHMLAVGDKVFKAAALEFFDDVEAGSI
jgi:pimeloyl-ACP methyl ester carboxylesterase